MLLRFEIKSLVSLGNEGIDFNPYGHFLFQSCLTPGSSVVWESESEQALSNLFP